MASTAATEGTSCGQWPPRPPGTVMATSAQAFANELPALSAGSTEILLAPPRLPQDPSYPPLAPPLEPAKGKGDSKRTAPSAAPELVSRRPAGWIPPAIHAALADLSHPAPAPTATSSGPTPSALPASPSGRVEGSLPAAAAREAPVPMVQPPAKPASPTHTQPEASVGEANTLMDDLRSMLAEPAKPKRTTRKSSLQMSVPALGSSAGVAQGVATRSRAAAAEARTVATGPAARGRLEVDPIRAEDVPEGLCEACRTPGSLLCCDECERAFHFTCLDPPWDLDRLPLGLVHDAPWSCNACRSRSQLRSKGKGKERILRPLMDSLERENPREFALPHDVQTHFHGVGADAGGAYLETDMLLPWRPVTIKATKMMLAPHREPYRMREKGELVLCFACGTSTLSPSSQHPHVDGPRRPMLSCDFCPLHWHLDCLDPPCTAPPSSLRKWRCPAHTEHDLPPVRRARNNDQPHTLDRAQGGQAHRPAVRLEESGHPEVLPERAVQRAFWASANKGVDHLQAYAAHHALTAKRGRITLTRAGQEYPLSVPYGLRPPPSVPRTVPPLGAVSADLRTIMTPAPYPSPLDSSLTFIAHPAPVPWPESGGGVLPVPAVSSAPDGANPGDAGEPAPAPQRRLPSRRSKTTGEAQRRDHDARKRKRRSSTAPPAPVQAPVVHGAEAEAALWRSTVVVGHATATQLAAVQRVVDYVGEEAARRFVSA